MKTMRSPLPNSMLSVCSGADKSAFCISSALSAQGRGAPSSGFALRNFPGPSALPLTAAPDTFKALTERLVLVPSLLAFLACFPENRPETQLLG